jgi:alpha(1,3/1,4) fucosyltransferase
MKKCLLFLLLLPLFLLGADRKKEIYLSHDWPIDPNDQSFTHAKHMKGIDETLREKNFHLLITDLQGKKDHSQLAYVVLWGKRRSIKASTLDQFPKKKLLIYLWEPPVVFKDIYKKSFLDRFKRVYTWDDDLVDNKKFFKFYYPVLRPMQKDLPSFTERKLAAQISTNRKSKHSKELYSARESVIQFFEDKPDGVFDFYGQAWDKKGYKNYRGAIPDKDAALKNYRFNICYENMRDVKGYITEKIFDAFAVGTVPIYWGASNIADYIPKNCFIDRRDFKSLDELYDYIRQMDQATYEAYQDNIRHYLESDKAKLFSQEMFNITFLEGVRFP